MYSTYIFLYMYVYSNASLHSYTCTYVSCNVLLSTSNTFHPFVLTYYLRSTVYVSSNATVPVCWQTIYEVLCVCTYYLLCKCCYACVCVSSYDACAGIKSKGAAAAPKKKSYEELDCKDEDLGLIFFRIAALRR